MVVEQSPKPESVNLKIQSLDREIRRLEHELAAARHQEEQYRKAFDLSGAPSTIIAADMTLVMVNREFASLTGYSRHEIEGKMKWTAFVVEEDVERMKGYHVRRRLQHPGIPEEYECQVRDRRGNIKDILVKVGMIDSALSSASFMEITSRKRTERKLRMSEARLSAMIEATACYMYTITDDYRIDFMNRALIAFVGSDARNKVCHKVLYNLDVPCGWCPIDSVKRGENVSREIRNPANGRWYHAIFSPIAAESGSVSSGQVMVIDITERKRKERDLKKAEKRLRKENQLLKSGISERFKFGELIGKSRPMREIYEQIVRAASVDANVIVYGESGTGKELTAKTIHTLSDRKDKPFVVVNCGAIPENLLESEFFGYRKGAFSGAAADRQGYMDLADGGTLFLDEIGEIGLNLQVKLLRVLEGGGYTPVGGNQLKHPDIRIIAATNRDLVKMVREGEVRLDFFYRLHIIPLHLPPLRERKEDLLLLAEHFLSTDKERDRVPPLTGEIIEKIHQYSWPGNVRELRNALHRYVTLKQFDILDPSLFVARSDKLFLDESDVEKPFESENDNLRSAIEAFEKQHIASVLARHRWHRHQAAGALGIDRKTLFRKIRRHGIK